ncbi:MAG: hypothetical protein WAT19_09845 [Ferruginibacter sp.]
MFEFLKILISFFEKEKIPYMLSGSVAMSIYTVPRFTRDFDFIVHLLPKDVPLLLECFKAGYYCDADAVKEAVKLRGMFNIIDHKSGYKADIMVLKNETYRQVEFERRKSVDFMDMKLAVVSPEDLLLSKLIWIQNWDSGIQKEDIKALSKTEGLQSDYIARWVKELKLNTFGLI